MQIQNEVVPAEWPRTLSVPQALEWQKEAFGRVLRPRDALYAAVRTGELANVGSAGRVVLVRAQLERIVTQLEAL